MVILRADAAPDSGLQRAHAPEPGTLLLMAIGLIAVGVRKRLTYVSD